MVIFYIIIMVLSYFFGKYNYMDKNISGFYETNNDFNIESGIKSMTFYIKSKNFLRYSHLYCPFLHHCLFQNTHSEKL